VQREKFVDTRKKNLKPRSKSGEQSQDEEAKLEEEIWKQIPRLGSV